MLDYSQEDINWKPGTKYQKNLKKKLSQDEFNTWIRPLQGEFKEDSLEISAPNDFVLNYVSNNLKNHISDVLASQNTKIIFNIVNWNIKLSSGKYFKKFKFVNVMLKFKIKLGKKMKIMIVRAIKKPLRYALDAW